MPGLTAPPRNAELDRILAIACAAGGVSVPVPPFAGGSAAPPPEQPIKLPIRENIRTAFNTFSFHFLPLLINHFMSLQMLVLTFPII